MGCSWSICQSFNTCVLDELSTGGADYCWKVADGRKVMGAIRSLVNSRSL